MVNKKQKLADFIRGKRGLATYAEIIDAGFSKTLVKAGLKSGRIQKVDRGLYKLSNGFSLSAPDIVAVSIKAPKGVVCLLSALAFHEATNEIPSCVHIAIPRGTHANKIKYPPVKYYRYNPNAWEVGIEEREIDGRKIKVYSLAKTIADCFKFRNTIGMNIARDALKVAVMEKGIEPKEIMRYAKVCRVDRIIKPIMEALV